MKKLTLFLLVLAVSINTTFAQNSDAEPPSDVWRLSILGPGIQYEYPTGLTTTIVGELGLGIAFGRDGFNDETYFDLTTIIGISPRYYYNLGKRNERDKNTSDYSANYLSFFNQVYLNKVLASTSSANEYFMGITWGFQRNLGKMVYFNFQIGPGVSIKNSDIDLLPAVGLNLGVKLN